MKFVSIRVHSWFKSFLLLACFSAAAADPLGEALQKGLFEEEANHNLDAAIKAYQSVIDQTAEQRKFSATAVFRLGECYRKLNKTNEAVTQYQRVLREFPDIATLGSLSQQNLAALGISSAKSFDVAAATSAEAEEIEKIKAMIKYSPDLINAAHPSGQTPLSRAALSGYLGVARFLLDAKADVNARDYDGSTPLHRATEAGHRAMVELLLDRGAEVNARDKKQNQPLHLATAKGFRSIVELLVARKADVNAKGESQQTPLYVAARFGNVALTKFLLDQGADVNTPNANGWTPLHVACREGTVDVAALLLERGVNVNAQDDAGWTALHHATWRSPDFVKLLLRYKPDLELQNSEGHNVLTADAANQKIPVETFELLLQAGANPNAPARPTTPLLAAVRAISPEKVRLLLEYKADPDKAVDKVTPLGYALHGRPNPSPSDRSKLAEMAELLRKHGANDELAKAALPAQPPPPAVIGTAVPVARNTETDEIDRLQRLLKESPDLLNARLSQSGGATPLHKAVEAGQLTVVQFLLTNKAHVNAKDTQADTPLHRAVLKGNKNMVELLLTNGADVNAVGGNYIGLGLASSGGDRAGAAQPLHVAVREGHQTIATILLTHKAEVNGRSASGRTPLHIAAEKGFLELAKYLVAKGADVNATDRDGQTPLYVATFAGHERMIEFLLENKADPNIASATTPLIMAIKQNALATVRRLLEHGADINAQADSESVTALHLAAGQRWPELLRMILARKPDLELANKYGSTPLLGAIYARDSSAV
jgi:ankyrin repeat protein